MPSKEIRFIICWALVILGLIVLGLTAAFTNSIALWFVFVWVLLYTWLYQEVKIRTPREPEQDVGLNILDSES